MMTSQNAGISHAQAPRIHRDTFVMGGHLDICVGPSHRLLCLPDGASHKAAQMLPRTATATAQAKAVTREKHHAIQRLRRRRGGIAPTAV